ncbi:choice-of-anchor J domain-containing protein, partial [Porphyromonas gulae]|uniref:choice-of-anchor J domain-containing protein n=1 Tax=Porphyromonas gulae TaxID=111105 RepID=UPI00190F6C4C
KDLPDGTKYVAFRHYNCTDVLAIVIDDVVITGEGGTSVDYTYTVYRDGTKIKEGLTATTFEEEGVAPGNHEYCVEVKYAAGVSPKKCVNVTVDPQQLNPVQNLTAEQAAQDAAWAGEHYAVYASSTGNDAANFTNALLEETLTAKSVVTAPEAIRGTRAQGTWYQKTVQLPAGTKYVAFRHFNCTDFF